MYEYLIGNLIIIAVWLVFFFLRKDLRRAMVWSGLVYLLILTVVFIFITFIPSWSDPNYSIVPGYWNPNTLFNLGRITHGYAIEDAIFVFFTGGIAAAIYEIVRRRNISPVGKNVHHWKAFIIGSLASVLFTAATDLNLIWSLIVFGFAGSATVWAQRDDLIPHSMVGGILFAGLYFCFFLMFNAIFPDFIVRFYGLENLTRIFVVGVPIEELLYALSFGMFWAPLYEYEHGVKVV